MNRQYSHTRTRLLFFYYTHSRLIRRKSRYFGHLFRSASLNRFSVCSYFTTSHQFTQREITYIKKSLQLFSTTPVYVISLCLSGYVCVLYAFEPIRFIRLYLYPGFL